MGIVLCSWYVLQPAYGDDTTLHAVGTSLNHLRAIIPEASLLLINLDTVTDYGLYGELDSNCE